VESPAIAAIAPIDAAAVTKRRHQGRVSHPAIPHQNPCGSSQLPRSALERQLLWASSGGQSRRALEGNRLLESSALECRVAQFRVSEGDQLTDVAWISVNPPPD